MAGLFHWIYREKFDSFAGIPGPSPWFPFGTMTQFLRGWPWERCADYAREYGGLTLVWLGGQPALVLNDPELIGEVLVDHWMEFYKDAPVKALQPVITKKDLFISNPGSGWEKARQENPLNMPNIDGWLSSQTEGIHAVMKAKVHAWVKTSSYASIDLYSEMQHLMFDAFAQAFWGRRLSPDFFRWFQSMASEGSWRMNNPLSLYLPILNLKFASSHKKWYDNFEAFVRQARWTPDPDAVDMLHVTLRRGTELSDAELAETIATYFFGGVFSCSSAVNTALYLLAKHPKEYTTLTESLKQEVNADRRVDRGLVENCQRLNFVVRESLRYYPPVPLYFRNSAKDHIVQLGKFSLPPNTLLLISNWYLHRSSGHWTQPEEFLPSRWSNGVVEANPIGSGYFFPFGRGPRMCIGMSFGMFVIKLALATILLESNVSLNPTQKYLQSFFFGVMMPKGLKATFN